MLENEWKSEQWIPRPPEEVFSFFSDAKNLELITPPWLNFKILDQSSPQIQSGTILNYKLKIHGIPVRWKTEILVWEPPFRFVDVQLKGPYSLWHHTHLFEAKDGGTLMKDIVRYRVPLGMLGRILTGAWVRRDIRGIFEHRSQATLTAFGK